MQKRRLILTLIVAFIIITVITGGILIYQQNNNQPITSFQDTFQAIDETIEDQKNAVSFEDFSTGAAIGNLTTSSETELSNFNIDGDDLSVYIAATLESGNKVLEIPVDTYGSSYIEKVHAKIPNWNSVVRQRFGVQQTQTVFLNTKNGELLIGRIGSENFIPRRINNRERWVFLENGNVYTTDPDYQDIQPLFDENEFDIGRVLSIIPDSSSNAIWLRTALDVQTGREPGLTYFRAVLNDKGLGEIPEYNFNTGDFVQNSREEDSLVQTYEGIISSIKEKTGRSELTEDESEIIYPSDNVVSGIIPAKGNQFLLQTSYYTDRFWLVEYSTNSADTITEIPQIKPVAPNFVFATCDNIKPICFVINLNTLELYEIDLNSTISVKKYTVSAETLPNYDLIGVIISKQAVGEDAKKLFISENGKPRLWYRGSWYDLKYD